jgi:hypothetical protein
MLILAHPKLLSFPAESNYSLKIFGFKIHPNSMLKLKESLKDGGMEDEDEKKRNKRDREIKI